MIAEDIQNLYKLLRGSRTASTVLEARALFVDNKWVLAKEKLAEARETYAERRSRLLKQDVEKQIDPKAADADRQRKKIQRKQEKAIEILVTFDELMPSIDRMLRRKQVKAPVKRAEQPKPSTDAANGDAPSDVDKNAAVAVSSKDIDEAFLQSFMMAVGDEKLDVIVDAFGFREVSSDEDLYPNSVYFICTEEQSSLLRTPSAADLDDPVKLVNLIEGRPSQSFARDAFLEMGRQQKMVLLTKNSADDEVLRENSSQNGGAEAEKSMVLEPQNKLDMGAFGQLLTSAQRCGIVSGAEQVGHIRDREFQKGQYDLAFQAINTMFTQFTIAAGQRAQQLVREEADIKGGRIKISPRDLQAKRIRDRAQTQEIERARRRFQVVLEGLRQLF